MRLNLGCGSHYAEGWVNLDVSDETGRVDQLVDPADPFATFPAGSAERVYLGHVLEHIYLPDVGPVLAQVRAVLGAGGLVLVVGPDMDRLLTRYLRGDEPRWLVEQAWENAEILDVHHPGTHKWNSSEARIVALLAAAGFVDVTPIGWDEFDDWPVTNWSEWQCAVRAMNPG